MSVLHNITKDEKWKGKKKRGFRTVSVKASEHTTRIREAEIAFLSCMGCQHFIPSVHRMSVPQEGHDLGKDITQAALQRTDSEGLSEGLSASTLKDNVGTTSHTAFIKATTYRVIGKLTQVTAQYKVLNRCKDLVVTTVNGNITEAQ